MSPIETFFTFSCASIVAVAALATWLRFTEWRSNAKQN